MIGDRWGVTDEETQLPYHCDRFVAEPTLQAWRGVTVAASREIVWGRLRQLRLAPYSYDIIDNLGRRSPTGRRELPEPTVGEPFTHAFGRDRGSIVAVETGQQLTARIMGTYLSYLVLRQGRQTRLLLKVAAEVPVWLASPLCIGDLLMARRQLLRIAALAEVDDQSRS